MRLLNLPLPIFAAVLAPQVEPPGAATIGEMLVLAAALSLPVGGILWALIEWRGRRVFATQTDLNGLGKRVDECESRGDRMEQMTDSTRERVGLIEAALASDRRYQADTVATPIQEIKAKLDSIAEQLTEIRIEHGQKIVEHDRDLSSLGRGMDELRRRVARIEETP